MVNLSFTIVIPINICHLHFFAEHALWGAGKIDVPVTHIGNRVTVIFHNQ